jgi:hypothetical protein
LPNPVINEINLTVATSKEQSCNISVMDASGKIIMLDKKKLLPGTNMIRYNTSTWAKGLYVVKLITGEGLFRTFKIIKQ